MNLKVNFKLNNNSLSFFDEENRWLNQYKKCGIAIEHSLISEEYCSQLIKEAHKSNKTDSFAPIMMPHRTINIFKDVLKFPKIITILNALMKEEFCGLQSQFFFSPPGTKGFSDHQDNFWIRASKPDKFISVWVALSDISPINGGIYFLLGSHQLGDLEVENIKEDAGNNQFANAREKQSIIPSNSKVYREDAYLSRGSVAFFNSRTVHGSHTNKSNQFRYALLNTYISKTSDFRSGSHAKREKINLI